MLASKVDVFLSVYDAGVLKITGVFNGGVFYLALEESALFTWMCSKLVSRWTKTLPPFCFPSPCISDVTFRETRRCYGKHVSPVWIIDI